MGRYTPYTEEFLLERFEEGLRQKRPPSGLPARTFIRELAGLQGRPDLVVARIHELPREPAPNVLANFLVSPPKARLLSVLRYHAPRRADYLATVTGLSGSGLKAHIRDLAQAGLVQVHANSNISLACKLPWSMVDIVTYEAKLSNWRRALHQALGYRSFSTSVSLVMPLAAARNAKQLDTIFANNGIGLISITDDGSPQVEIKLRRKKPTSRRFYLMAVGLIISYCIETESFIPLHQP